MISNQCLNKYPMQLCKIFEYVNRNDNTLPRAYIFKILIDITKLAFKLADISTNSVLKGLFYSTLISSRF